MNPPKLATGVDLTQHELSPAEGYVASRIDGKTSLHELAQLTGLSDEQVQQVIERLEAAGVLEAPPIAAEPEDAPGASHLKLYQEQLASLPATGREQLARTATGPTLAALCYDPLPGVIREVLQNPHCSPEHGRLIAAHHQNGTGLEFLLGRADLMRDAEVQRRLWRNPQLNEGQVRRITVSKRLLELWKLTVSREVTQHARSAVTRVMRTRFQNAPAEERVELIFNTEGRALGAVAGIPVDGRTAAQLCARTYSSLLLIQNIAHWSSAPPAVIAHLLKQALVQRNPRLKQMLQQHPNAPHRHQ